MVTYLHLHSPFSPSLISLVVSVDVKHHERRKKLQAYLELQGRVGLLLLVGDRWQVRLDPALEVEWC